VIAPSYTAISDPGVDRLVAAHLAAVRDAVRLQVHPDKLAGIALFGGYGRGEGGVVVGSDGARPHNNYDLLVVLKDVSRWHAAILGRRLRALNAELRKRLGVGVDLSAISLSNLKHVPPQIFWYDIRKMHHIVEGADDLLSVIPSYGIGEIPQQEQARLVLNRAALLAINRLIWSIRAGRPSERQQQAMIKHAAKAILGFGDAVLLASGRYEVSYRKKVPALLEASEATGAVTEEFRELHRWATEFRFQPDYSNHAVDDIAAIMDVALREGQRIHLWFEERRIGDLAADWSDYLNRFEQSDGQRSGPFRMLTDVPRRALQNLSAFGIPRRPSGRDLRWLPRDPFLRVMATLPAALYSDAAPAYRREAAQLLGAPGSDVLEPFVNAWARVLDPNAGPVLQELGLR
jgi:hypothetical protein